MLRILIAVDVDIQQEFRMDRQHLNKRGKQSRKGKLKVMSWSFSPYKFTCEMDSSVNSTTRLSSKICFIPCDSH